MSSVFDSLLGIEELDETIRESEVHTAIRNLWPGKACGTDKVLVEILKSAEEQAVGFLTNYFNSIFASGQCSDMWKEAIIVPIYKKGYHEYPNKYRFFFQCL